MKYLLDTDTCSYLLQGRESVEHRIRQVHREGWAISAITAYELDRVRGSRSHTWRSRIDPFLRSAVILPFHKDQAAHAAKACRFLEDQGLPINQMDLLIAGHAISKGLILVTHNVRHFGRIPDLTFEDWAA